MSEHTNHTVDDQLLAKYLSGEALPDEAILVETWLNEPGNKVRFASAAQLFTQLSGEAPHLLPNQETAWKHLMAAAQKSQPTVAKISRPKIVYRIIMVASLLLVAGIGSWFLFFHQSAHPSRNITEMITRQSDHRLLQDTLPDGSAVVLNSHSSIVYPPKFTAAARQVALQGEAWFDVQQKPGWPFLITAGPVTVKILGTSFNIRENKDSVTVWLISGSVRMCTNKDSITLQAGQQGIYDILHQRFIKADISDINQAGYATRSFEFHNASLGEITSQIAKAYDLDIIFSNKILKNCTMSSTFENQSIEYIMNVIAVTLNIQYKIENKKVYISGTGCE